MIRAEDLTLTRLTSLGKAGVHTIACLAKLSRFPKDAIRPACKGGNGSVTILHERQYGRARGRLVGSAAATRNVGRRQGSGEEEMRSISTPPHLSTRSYGAGSRVGGFGTTPSPQERLH